MHIFLTTLLQTLKKSFTAYYGAPHIVAIIGTYLLVVTNFDWHYFLYMHSSRILTYIFYPAIPIGGVIPIIVPALCTILGYGIKNKKIVSIGWMLMQAMILGSFISSTYKFFTGRIQPNTHDLITNISHEFNFGLSTHGVFWGWPSSHTTIAFAMVLAVIQFFPKQRVVHILLFLYAFYIGIGISFSIHWFSEFFAGACIGSIIGIVVGRNFNGHYVETNEHSLTY